MSVSAVPVTTAAPAHHGFFANHNPFQHHPATTTTAMPYGGFAAGQYQQYQQYAQQPQYHGAVLSQQQFAGADTNHDGKVSQAEMTYASAHVQAAAHQGIFHSPFQHAPTYTAAAPTQAGYQQYMQYAHQPQYHGAVLSQQAYMAADTNHDGKVSQTEMQYATAHYQPSVIPQAASMVAHPAAFTGQQSMQISNIKVTGGNLASSAMDKSDPYAYFLITEPGWFHSVKGQTSVKKSNTQPDWTGEVVKMEKINKPETLSLEVTVYDKDLLKDDKLGTFKVDLSSLYSKGNIKKKIDNNLFKSDVFLEFDYTTTWGPEPPKPSKKKSKKKKSKSGGCC